MTATLKPIRDEDDYELALARIGEVWNARPGTAEADELEALSILVEAYEKLAHPIPPPDPVDAIRFAMEQRGLRPKDLEPILGSSGRVSEVLGKKRALTLSMIRELHSQLGLEPEVLIRRYRLKPAGAKRVKGKSATAGAKVVQTFSKRSTRTKDSRRPAPTSSSRR